LITEPSPALCNETHDRLDSADNKPECSELHVSIRCPDASDSVVSDIDMISSNGIRSLACKNGLHRSRFG